MFERLMLCEFAVADLTTINPNVLCELGIRHGARPHTTILIFGKQTRLPFLCGLPYSIDDVGGPEMPAEDRKALAERLISVREPTEDSPLFQLVSAWPRPDIARLKTDQFREVVEYSRKYKEKLLVAREAGVDAVAKVETELDIRDTDPAIVSYRAVEAFQKMIDLVPRMSEIVARTVMVRGNAALP
jgi:hypothetical protein